MNHSDAQEKEETLDFKVVGLRHVALFKLKKFNTAGPFDDLLPIETN